MPKVSIIIPVYNTGKYLRDCLESVVNQTLKDIEVIIINDGSTDDSPKIISEFSEKYEFIKVFDKENGGQGMARNIGISKSQGEYIGFVDSDDYIEKDMYEVMYEKAITDGSDLVECNYAYVKVGEKGIEEMKPYGYVREYKDKKDMFRDPLVSPWNKLYKGEFLRDGNVKFPEGVIYEDTAFFVKGIPYMENRSFIDKKFVKHFYRNQSTMNKNKGKKVADIFKVLNDIIDYYKEKGIYEEYREEIEAFSVKILLRSSLGRVAKVGDRKVKKKLKNDTWKMIQENFPKFKENRYLKAGKKGLYFKSFNKFTLGIYCFVFKFR